MNQKSINAVALSVRMLSIDAIQKANSGHPGLPLGCAELGAVLFAEILSHYPPDPKWINRDRFVLSAGHGSMLLYSLLHLCGYDLSLEDIKNFRQLGSKTPGHPEFGHTPGVETTTGPLGQGLANAVGMALAEKMLAARFNKKARPIIDHYTYVLAGDGDLMEGVCYEAASLAGHLELGKLIVFYDSNHITIDGKTGLTFSEDVEKRFQACGWQTLSGDAYDLQKIVELVERAKEEKTKPSIIVLESEIGRGSPSFAGTHKVHGSPLGSEEIKLTRKKLGVPDVGDFYIAPEAQAYFQEKLKGPWKEEYEKWKEDFASWEKENPQLAVLWQEFFHSDNKLLHSIPYVDFEINSSIATREANGKVLSALASRLPNLVGGSADLQMPNFVSLENLAQVSKNHPEGRWIYFGVREHAMGSISNGIALHGGLRAFCSTFLVFSDYFRPSIRLAALSKLPVIFLLTHDSVLCGEDGPTHQPIEHLASLRLIPNTLVLRPGDAQETDVAWRIALEHTCGPTALVLTRQAVTVYEKQDGDWRQTIRRGAYIVRDCPEPPELVIIATGSEVNTAIEAGKQFPEKKIRVVSMLSKELFLDQDLSFQEEILPPEAKRIVVEAGAGSGWERFFADNPPILSIETFGLSAPGPEAAKALGLDAASLAKRIEQII